MPGSSLFTLIDDIATILDDVAAMTKVATKKTAGVLGDDLALNAEKVTGVKASRELPVVWAVTKGSLVNKAILVPAALAISALAPWGITPLLMLGGLFLCFEGVEKVTHKLFHAEEAEAHDKQLEQALLDPKIDMVQLEKDKIKGAIRTDFILSAELIVIALGTVAEEEFVVRVGVLIGIAMVMTVGVYGLVAAIVKLDDLGLYLSEKEGGVKRLGEFILRAAPWLMKTLSVAGTAAMFLVGGGIVVHGIPPIHHFVEHLGEMSASVGWLLVTLANFVTGFVAGALVVAVVSGIRKLIPAKADAKQP